MLFLIFAILESTDNVLDLSSVYKILIESKCILQDINESYFKGLCNVTSSTKNRKNTCL